MYTGHQPGPLPIRWGKGGIRSGVTATYEHKSMSKIVGIDFGTTNSLVATVDSGIPLVIADADGRRLTPSVVHFPGLGADPLVGQAANRVRVLQPTLFFFQAEDGIRDLTVTGVQTLFR